MRLSEFHIGGFVEHVLETMIQQKLLDTEAANQISEAARTRPLDDALKTAIKPAPGLTEDKLLRFLANYFGVSFIDLEKDA
ncbi:MAG: hypothetical protein JO353_04235, partial [Phycisphaerae bacterium]|nr:hypothetical protein [Phycisphaerae bacterium]